ncbi:glycerol-3-phosphate dehydrogenase/oxidase [Mycobacteroides chelonae]|uniref:Glycerol-3-phosphate dehydrogenase n=1 Tax=Mycobacteroides chelonae TaxID=1774 RepID=A0AB73U6J4_MYCCH|nr:glycerol-3-phosphate dehydrogenase/oxidase [Mycobacteroides chelonae]MEC4842286.1 glycerol-3-phosphate dehydrogenase/oxidase [Mycobacteroides chelonae]MEC4847126.1 glycerol-3-phosphate dehydrogenase/oxidase [Mycobacteroides chelonae]OLT80227.1 glycerol-3-phosphate dehydrogenase [Mycobacteroides chelonae]QDF72245.1 glycerol-3-phosphate dehydrogenase/oxidase [Mycobacteroides chelonae]
MTTQLNSMRRGADLAALTGGAPTDVLVIGGGITGVGVALDAASRGLRVTLVEKHDLAFGTSRFSSKLVHGGLRYLASGQVGIARESAIERHILMTRTAPHLIHPLAQVVPLHPAVSMFSRTLVRVGFVAGDGLRKLAHTSADVLPRSRAIDAGEVIRRAPTVRRNGLRGGLMAFDGQLVDDARLVVSIARTAAGLGARILTRVCAEEVTGDGALLRDELTGNTVRVEAGLVINAAGVWAGQVDHDIKLRPSRGTHLVFRAASFGGLTAALTVPVPGTINRFVFALPAIHDRVYLGLTDEPAPGPIPDVAEPSASEEQFLLDTVNTVLQTSLSESDVVGRFAGLRPLLDGDDSATADLSRKHAVRVSDSGVVSVVGGKLTTYRKMAQDALDAGLEHRPLAASECVTQNLAVVDDWPGAVGAQLVSGVGITREQVEFALTHEGALDTDDILDRRTRIGLVPADKELAAGAVQGLVDSYFSQVN